jgi:hypothetical protein
MYASSAGDFGYWPLLFRGPCVTYKLFVVIIGTNILFLRAAIVNLICIFSGTSMEIFNGTGIFLKQWGNHDVLE